MKRLLLLGLVGCGAGGADIGPGLVDAHVGCTAHIDFDPSPALAIAGPLATERAIARVDSIAGLPTYQWRVRMGIGGPDLTFSDAQADHSAIAFAIPTSGTYEVQLDVSSGTLACPSTIAELNALAGSGDQSYRLRVRAPGTPPQERMINVPTGTPSYAFGPYGLDKGKDRTGTVIAGAAHVPAYLKIAPAGAPDEYVEAFSDGNGAFSATLLEQPQTVLVIPATPGLAPKLFTNISFTTPPTFQLDAGIAVTGTVRGPTGAALAGAHVQLAFDDVPSTLATTAADGSFTVRAAPSTSALITVDVTPFATSGLPRLTVTGATFDAAQPFAIAYVATLAPRDLAGVRVTRGGTGVATAPVTVTHPIGIAGTVTSGGSGAVGAAGQFRATATTDASGLLPALKVPPALLSVVVQVGAADYAVASVDLAAGVPATIAAPLQVPVAFAVTDLADHALRGVTVDATPVGALALAGAVPIRVTSSATGDVALAFASGGSYDLRIHDPQSRAAPVTLPATTTGIPATVRMPAATRVTGDIAVNGLGASAGALVQVLCATCTGIDRTRPLAEVLTDGAGHYAFTIADPSP